MVIDEIADKLESNAYEALRLIDGNELQNWKRHPATQALLRLVQHEYLSYYVELGAGYRTHGSLDSSMLDYSKALGAIESLEAVEGIIENIHLYREDADDEEESDD